MISNVYIVLSRLIASAFSHCLGQKRTRSIPQRANSISRYGGECGELPGSIAAALQLGIATVITPMIFTGISGGHDIDWYPHRVDVEDVSRTPAWGHLTGEAVPGDTHLNRLTRKEFRDLFMTEFDIVQEEETRPDLGRQHLTAERRQALQAFDEQELFSNTVRFVLRKKRTAVSISPP